MISIVVVVACAYVYVFTMLELISFSLRAC